MVNQGGILHTFTEVRTFGSGVDPAVQRGREQRPHRRQAVDGTPPSASADIGTVRCRPGSPGLDVVPAKGVHNYQCIFHPWMRTVVTVR